MIMGRCVVVEDRDIVLKRLNLSSVSIQKMDKYVEILREEQLKMNLVGSSTLPVLWIRHILDSAQLFQFIAPSDKVILDLGSGAGFPALVLAVMDIEKKYEIHLIESDGKKCSFLNKVIKECDLRAFVHYERIEKMEKFDVDLITARALAPLDKLIKYAYPFISSKTRCLFMKGAKAEEEIKQALKKYRFCIEKIPSITSHEGTVILLSEVKKK